MKSNIPSYAIMVSVAFFFQIGKIRAGCGDFGLPQDKFDGVNEFGIVSYWEQIATLDLKDASIPLNLSFQADRQWFSPNIGGPGWWLGIADSNFVQRGPDTFEMLAPDGYSIGFGRDPKIKNILNGSRGYKAELNGETISVHPACGGGWKLVFTRGKLSSLSRGNHNLRIVRSADERIKEVLDGPTVVLRTEIDPRTNFISALILGGKRFEFRYDKKPRVQSIAGQNVVTATDLALSQISFPNGETKTYEFPVDEKINPILKIVGADESRSLTWDAGSSKISKDVWTDGTSWTYDIKPAEKIGMNAAIKRVNSKGQMEFWEYDAEKGIETFLSNGTTTIKTWFASGKLAGKLRKIEHMREGKKSTAYQASYNESGTMLRENFPLSSRNVDLRSAIPESDALDERIISDSNGYSRREIKHPEGKAVWEETLPSGEVKITKFENNRVVERISKNTRVELRNIDGKRIAISFRDGLLNNIYIEDQRSHPFSRIIVFFDGEKKVSRAWDRTANRSLRESEITEFLNLFAQLKL